MPRQDWNTPTRVDAYRSLMGIPDDNSYYTACTGFKQSAGFSDIDNEFQQACVDAFGYAPIRIQNLTDEAVQLHQSNGWSSAQRGVQCVLDQGDFVLNPKQTEFQKFCINNCVPVKATQSGEWERAGQAVRDSYRQLWEKFLEMYPPDAASS